MLAHGKQVRRVSFLLDATKAASGVALRRIGKVSFLVSIGNYITFIDVKYSLYLFL